MAAADDDLVELRSKDGDVIEIPYSAAQLSELVRDSVADDEREVQVLRVSTDCLKKVVEFLKYHVREPMVAIPTPLGASSFEEIVKPEWYKEFVNLERAMIFDLLTAANYMGIKPLLDLTCLKVTFELTGKSAEEIRQLLNLPKLTAEEEAKARVEHKWVFEDA
mmetsp:Transcript_25566/g.35995  ORF Transcript_25566/g.35995 Transcript_25566/m.35995 type:complete len:164 (+) Transcript_25566:202-693(+)